MLHGDAAVEEKNEENTAGALLWYWLDTKFLLPKAEVVFELQGPFSAKNR